MIAPRAEITSLDWAAGSIRLDSKRRNVINLSYGMLARPGLSQIAWDPQSGSIIAAARAGTAVVVKSAGNSSTEMNRSFPQNGQHFFDYLSRDLVGLRTAIFVGALERNGSTATPAALASYSNRAGTDSRIQNQFLVAGVPSNLHGLAGTSFAAPVVAGYAAIVGSKFPRAKPEAITRQLLNTARTDTIRGYRRHIHGRGEASLSRALAPRSIR